MSSAIVYKQDQAFRLSPPVDFSFKQIASEDDILNQRPRKNRTGKVPLIGSNNKFVTTAVWLSNNLIQTTDGAVALLSHILEFPVQLAWLDLSFNRIYDISEALQQYQNLKILYLHGNQIQNVSAISILQGLPKLRTLTLHGNPIDSIPQYRSHIIKMLPQISNLDFSPIVDSEKKEVPPTGYIDRSEQKKSPRKN